MRFYTANYITSICLCCEKKKDQFDSLEGSCNSFSNSEESGRNPEINCYGMVTEKLKIVKY